MHVMLINASDDARAQRRFCGQFSEPTSSDGVRLYVARVRVVHGVLVCCAPGSRVGAHQAVC